MKKQTEQQREELDQFQAYGEYSYSYRHSADERRKKGKRNRPEDGEISESETLDAQAEPYDEPEETLISPEERARARSRSITGRLIFLLAVAVITIIILQGTVFRLKTVYVIGNKNLTAQQVAAASGLVKGLNIFSISEADVRDNLSKERSLIFKGLQKDYPSTIYLYVTEREAVAFTQWLGLQYTLDAEGFVMEENSSLSLPKSMPSVTGLQITSVHVGQKLEVRSDEQMMAYEDIMSELGLQYYRDQITEMNLSDQDNLYLLTASGISVRLGNRQYMRAKIGALRTDMAYLQQLGKTSGVLDVSIPEDAKYRPDS